MHYRAISNTGSHFEVFESERFTLVCFRILMAIQLAIKESWVCGFVFYYIYFCPRRVLAQRPKPEEALIGPPAYKECEILV